MLLALSDITPSNCDSECGVDIRVSLLSAVWVSSCASGSTGGTAALLAVFAVTISFSHPCRVSGLSQQQEPGSQHWSFQCIRLVHYCAISPKRKEGIWEQDQPKQIQCSLVRRD